MMILGWPWPVYSKFKFASMCFYMENLHFFSKNVRKSFNGRNYNKWPEWQTIYVDLKILTPVGCLSLLGAIYMYKSMKKYV